MTIFRWIGLILIAFYQSVLRGHFGGSGCRFWPTCSCYARDAIAEHGLFKGGWLALKRLSQCHPWGKV